MRRLILIALAIAAVGLAAAISQATIAGGEATRLSYNPQALRSGDLLFVEGTTWQSWIVLWSGGNNDFSHVGLVWVREDNVFIIHATPHSSGERKAEGVIVEPLHQFLSPDRVTDAALYRFTGASRDLASTVVSLARQYAINATPFDYSFDLSSDAKMYCTELIWAVYRAAGVNLFGDVVQQPDAILMPSELSSSRQLIEVTGFRRTR